MTGTALTTTAEHQAVALPDQIAAALANYQRHAEGAVAANTERALKADSRIFADWCASIGRKSLPAEAETVAAFVDAMGETRKPATVGRYLATIARMHRAADQPDPTKAESVRLRMKALRRAKGARQRQAAALRESFTHRLEMRISTSARDLRDAAMLRAARCLMARRSELVALDLSDIMVDDSGQATATIRRSKTDQDGAGSVLPIDAVTHAALRRYLDAAGVTEGALFRSISKGGSVGGRLPAGDVARTFKRLAALVGMDPADISGHSARVGMAQDLTSDGASLPEVMQAGRWKSAAMPARYAEHQAAHRGAVAKFFAKRQQVPA